MNLNSFRYFRQHYTVAFTAVLTAAIVGTLVALGAFQLLEWSAYDAYFRLRPATSPDARVVIVKIDESDIRWYGQWPISDAKLSTLLETIAHHKPRAVGLDLFRDLPVPPGEENLTRDFETIPNLFAVEKVLGQTVPAPQGTPVARSTFVDFMRDGDANVRRALLSIQVSSPSSNSGDRLSQYGLGAALALHYLKAQDIHLQVVERDRDSYRLGKTILYRFRSHDGGYVRADDGGYQILLNYRSAGCTQDPQRCPFRIVNAREVIQVKIPTDFFRDRLVLIGAMAPSIGDLFYTPYSTSTNDSYAHYGVEIHAHIASQLLAAALDGRPLINVWDEPVEWLWMLVWAIGGAQLGKHCLRLHWRLGAIAIAALGAVAGIGYAAFLWGWWIPIFPAGFAFIVAAIAVTLWILWQNLRNSYLQLEEYARTLECKVEARTADLKQEIAQRRQTELALQAANDELQRLSMLDGLTQVANRRRFDAYLLQEWQRAQRERTHIALLLTDVDFFKRFNDTYGHQAGDRCLQQVAEALRLTVKRPTDLVARYGGEEFAAILPATDAEGALLIAEALCQSVRDLGIPHQASEVSDRVTLSVGVQSWIPDSEQTIAGFLAATDAVLYAAKHSGRDRVCATP